MKQAGNIYFFFFLKLNILGLIASLSMIEAMKATKVGMSEHQLAAIMEYHIKMR